MRVSDSKLLNYWQVYCCSLCKTEQLVRQVNSKKTVPTSCKEGCRAIYNFELKFDSPHRVYEPQQIVRIQESIHLADNNSGMKYIDAILKYDLVDSVSVGDDVLLTGILRVDKKRQKQGVDNSKDYLQTVTIEQVNKAFTVQQLTFTDKDMEAIALIKQQRPSVFRFLINSLAPNVNGQKMVKAGLLLSLFSGSTKSTHTNLRENIHILMVGDPGMGKSVLLDACCNVAPKAIYSVSSHLSGAGLTAGVKQINGRFTIEGGVLVLADGGVCCIDEIDKKANLHVDLLDVSI